MPFKRFVEIGRVAYVAYGEEKGKLCVIVDVIDQNRALVDGPCSNIKRQQINFKAMELTDFKINIGHSSRTKVVEDAWKKDEITKKWEATSWAKKIDRNRKRANLTDFDRFKLMRLKQRRNKLVNVEFGKLRKQARKAEAKK